MHLNILLSDYLKKKIIFEIRKLRYVENKGEFKLFSHSIVRGAGPPGALPALHRPHHLLAHVPFLGSSCQVLFPVEPTFVIYQQAH